MTHRLWVICESPAPSMWYAAAMSECTQEVHAATVTTPCPGCGYPLTVAGTTTCPECGVVVDVPRVREATASLNRRLNQWIGWMLIARAMGWCLGHVVSELPYSQASGSGRDAAELLVCVPQLLVLIAGMLYFTSSPVIPWRRAGVGLLATAFVFTALSVDALVAQRVWFEWLASVDWASMLDGAAYLTATASLIVLQRHLLRRIPWDDPLFLASRFRPYCVALGWIALLGLIVVWAVSFLPDSHTGGSPFGGSTPVLAPPPTLWSRVLAQKVHFLGAMSAIGWTAWLMHSAILGLLLVVLSSGDERQHKRTASEPVA
jgi:hypothetical protein